LTKEKSIEDVFFNLYSSIYGGNVWNIY
jgi:hypothetical protein